LVHDLTLICFSSDAVLAEVMNMLMYVNEKVTTVSESLRSGLGKLLCAVDDIILTSHRIIHILQKDSEHFNDHVTQVTADIRHYVVEQKERVTEDATVM